MSLTPAQREAVAARGNVLVMAGAGTGKTSTLVERCLDCLLVEKPPVSIEEILMVTFTEAAAAEMRKRIRDRLEEESSRLGSNNRWHEQLALFEATHFGTLHSFCFQLVRQHFYQLEMDPQLSVLAEEEARVLADETLESLFQRHYAGKDSTAQAVQQLIKTHGRGWDQSIRALVLKLHHYSQTLPNPAAWRESQLAMFVDPEPSLWRRWLEDALSGLTQQWLPALDSLGKTNLIAAQCAKSLRETRPGPSLAAFGAAFGEIALARQNCPRGKRTTWLDPLDGFLAEAEFLNSLIDISGRTDPLAEDWSWVRFQMITLLELSRDFTQAFTEGKRELGVLDFHDLEQYSLQLLWDQATNQPTRMAEQWRERIRFIFVDEYQDINAAQDQIIKALAREGTESNRFLVGDVKQSIYRFRLANPHIFQGYAKEWDAHDQGRVLPLVDNFRSREGLLNFVNSLFGLLGTKDLWGLDYSGEVALRFGAPKDRAVLSSAALAKPSVEVHLLLKSGNEIAEEPDESSEAVAEVLELQEADKEARLVAMRCLELYNQRHLIWDLQKRQFRPVDWKDMAILLRSPARKVESYAKEFARLNLPLLVARGAFYRSVEVTDLLSLLQILDNPLQDLPLLAVLHSPLVGLGADELAEIRLTAFKTRFWAALNRWHRGQSGENGPGDATQETHAKVATFLHRFARWRRLARQASLSNCLETVVAETHYDAWLLTQPRGAQRSANLGRLITLAREFDQFQRQGLFRFLKFVEAQRQSEAEPEVASCPGENAVRLMSIHQSKGLEFPVVVVADLGKAFNLVDLRADIILDESYGVCPVIKPPNTGKRYPSLSYWLARRRQLRELLGEELRLLYVATTRARDTLILSGAITRDKFSALYQNPGNVDAASLLAARSFSDWLGLWFSLNSGAEMKNTVSGETELFRWFVHDQTDLLRTQSQTSVEPAHIGEIDFESAAWQQVRNRLAWQYPFIAATKEPAKRSVSSLRRQLAEDDELSAIVNFRPSGGKRARPKASANIVSVDPISPISEFTAADIGIVHHRFLQLVSWDHLGDATELMREAERLEGEGQLSHEETAVLDFETLAHFWDSELGHRIRASREWVHRELVFTARITPSELEETLGLEADSSLKEEFVLVQGVVDLAVIGPAEIWLVDFKTDEVKPDELEAKVQKYAPQLKLYAKAMTKIYQRPVTNSWLNFLALRKAVLI